MSSHAKWVIARTSLSTGAIVFVIEHMHGGEVGPALVIGCLSGLSIAMVLVAIAELIGRR